MVSFLPFAHICCCCYISSRFSLLLVATACIQASTHAQEAAHTPCRRPHDQVPLPQASRTFTEWLQLRRQVLDVLWRAHAFKGKSSCPILHELDLSAASSIDICALYAFDARDMCSSIMQALLKKESLQGDMAITLSVYYLKSFSC